MKIKATKSGVKSALISMGYGTGLDSNSDMPSALWSVQSSSDFTDEDMAFARYLIYDTDFGGAWNDDEQINMHCA